MNRKYLMSPPIHGNDAPHFIQQSYAVTHSYDDKRENEMRVQACKKGSETWVQFDVERHYEKQSRSLSICLNKAQAEALRDLLNNAIGGSSRVAHTTGSALYGGLAYTMTEAK